VQRSIIQPQLRQRAGAEVLEQHVGAPGDVERQRPPARMLEVDRHRLLVAVDRHEVRRLAAEKRRPERARVVAARRMLQLDHARPVAILNQKGGTGKTTTAINLAAGLADRGYDVLLVDLDAQGNVGASLGIRGERTLYHLLVEDAPVGDVIVPVRNHLDVITSDATLAAAEVHLARLDGARDRVLADHLSPGISRGRYEYVVLDCGPSLSLLNQNALSFVDEVMIPVSCDYLALVGVK